MKEFDKLSMEEVMSLYRKKISAEKKNDKETLIALEQQYPDLFSCEFDEFISNLRMSIEYIRHKHDEDFRKILEPEDIICH